MKNVLITLSCLLLLAVGNVQAQTLDSINRHAVKVNIFSLVASAPSFGYEYLFANRHSVDITLACTDPFDWNVAENVNGAFAQLHYRLYLSQPRRSGLTPFFGMGINYSHVWEHLNMFAYNDGWDIYTTDYVNRRDRVSPSLMFGLRVNTSSGLMVETTIGIKGFSDDRLVWCVNGYNYLTTMATTKIGWTF